MEDAWPWTVVFAAVLFLTLLFTLFHRPDRIRPRVCRLSTVQIVSAASNGCLGSAYLFLAALRLVENLRKSHSLLPVDRWLPTLLQGVVWASVGVTVSVRAPVRRLSILAFLFALFVSGLSLFLDGRVTPDLVFNVLSLPGAVLLLLCAYRDDTAESGPYSPPNGEAGVTDKDEPGTTKFARAGVCNTLSFWWLNSMMKQGREKTLTEEDMPKLREGERAESCYLRYTEELEKRKRKNPSSQPSMLWVIISCHWRDIFLSGFFALLKIITLSAGPLLLNAFILVSEGKQSFQYEGYVLALTLFLAKNLESLSQRQWYFRSRLIGLKVRSLLTAAIYKKQLRLSNSAKLKHSGGEIMNYFIVDAYRIGEFPFWFHQTWTTLLQLCLASVILFRAVGLATLASLAAIVLSVLCNAPLAKLQHKFQTKLMTAQDERLKATSEALVNMKVLKLYAWERHFKGVVEALRKAEEKWLSSVQLWTAYNWFLFWLSPLLVSAATFGACYFLKIPLQANNVFTFVATLRLVQDPVRSISDILAVVIQAKVAFARVVRFLDAPELESWTVRLKGNPENSEKPITIKSANFLWDAGLSKSTLRNINLEIGPGEKMAVCGEVGSGKSTLLAAILGEVPNVHGSIQVYGRIAYVSQTAWIQTGTIQDNILFGSPMHHQRYQETVERCALVKDFELLPYGDLTEIGERGVNLSGGQKQRIQLARALYQNADIYLLDDPFSAVDAHTATTLFNEYVMEALSEKTVLLVTHQVDFLPAFDMVLLISDGEILEADSYHRLIATSRVFQELVNAHKETAGLERLAHISLNKNDQVNPAKEICKSYEEKQYKESKGDQLIKLEERETGDRGLKPYKQYLNQNKGYLYFSFAALGHVMFVIGQILQNTWLAVSVDDPNTTTLRMIAVYLLIGLGSALFLFVRSLSVVILGVSSSHSLFLQLLNSLFRAPMAFYDSTPLGRILSRVSADLSVVDLDVPFSLIVALGTTMSCIANLGVLSVMAWQVLFVSIPTLFVAIQLQRYYFSTAKELMRLNGTTKSLMANHLAESVAGAMTIRAFEEENRFFAKNLNLVDIGASPFFLSFSAKEWLIQRLETLSAIVLASAALCMVLLPPATFSSGFIGMTLSYGLSLNMQLVFAIQNNCSLANNIISVERLNQYMNVPSEAPEVIEENRPPANWPSAGNIEIHDLQIRYRSNAPLVLRGISCTFVGGHKIGIVGRTGSGKTTLISALFRLVEPAAGKIVVDGIDIARIGLHDLRSRFGIIPQDPTLFNGTVRYNLDPLSQHSDQKIWEILGECQLREAVLEKEEGLDSLVVDDGSNWSMGQRQLFCLGRALLRRSRILVLDEATASIDNATDMILQRTIRTEFSDCTVITVAHRIPTVMDCTMVLVMSDGQIIEYDEPLKLMKREGSLFGKLVKEYWSHSQSVDSL